MLDIFILFFDFILNHIIIARWGMYYRVGSDKVYVSGDDDGTSILASSVLLTWHFNCLCILIGTMKGLSGAISIGYG